MSDYSNTYNGAAKDAANSIILGADVDTELDNVATMSATKADKVASATLDNIATLDVNGNLKDSGAAIADYSLKTKVIDIGDWNMWDTGGGDVLVLIPHGLTQSNIRTVNALIRDDIGNSYWNFLTHGGNGDLSINGSSVRLTFSSAGSIFNDTDFDSTSYNRGWITIQYI